MPLIHSAIKKMRKDETRTQANKIFIKKMKSSIKKALNTKKNKEAVSLIDKAVKKKIIKKNKAARLKSKLAKITIQNKK